MQEEQRVMNWEVFYRLPAEQSISYHKFQAFTFTLKLAVQSVEFVKNIIGSVGRFLCCNPLFTATLPLFQQLWPLRIVLKVNNLRGTTIATPDRRLNRDLTIYLLPHIAD